MNKKKTNTLNFFARGFVFKNFENVFDFFRIYEPLAKFFSNKLLFFKKKLYEK